MKAARQPFFIVLLALFAFSLAGCQQLQKYDVAPDPAPRFAKAKAMEATTPILAMDEYQKIRNEYGSPKAKDDAEFKKYHEVAGQALLNASVFGYDILDPVKVATKAPTTAEQAEKDDIAFKVSDRGHQAIKELLEKFSDTPAAQQALKPVWGDGKDRPLREAQEIRLDQRNSQLAKYKVVSGLVRMTGSVPGFSYWFALVLIAFLVKAATFPLTLKQYKSQREMQRIQPYLKEIQAKHKDDRVKMQEATMATYKEHGVSPFAACLPTLIQMPFLYLVYDMIRQYEFHFANGHFLWISPGMGGTTHGVLAGNLAQFDIILLVVYCFTNLVTMRLTPPSDPAAAAQQKQMSVMMTFVMFWMFLQYKWSSAFTFYWLIQNFISMAQQYHYIYKPNKINLSDAINMKDGTESASASATASAFRAKSEPKSNSGLKSNVPTGGKPSTGNLATPRPVSSNPTSGRPRAKGKGKRK